MFFAATNSTPYRSLRYLILSPVSDSTKSNKILILLYYSIINRAVLVVYGFFEGEESIIKRNKINIIQAELIFNINFFEKIICSI